MTSPILVIGALGNVGAEVVKQILARGGNVRAVDLDVKKLRERFGDSGRDLAIRWNQFALTLLTPLPMRRPSKM